MSSNIAKLKQLCDTKATTIHADSMTWIDLCIIANLKITQGKIKNALHNNPDALYWYIFTNLERQTDV